MINAFEIGHRFAAMAGPTQGTPYISAGPLALSIREWVEKVWPSARLRRRTVIELALSRLREGHQLVITPAGDAVAETITASGSEFEICYHGCNPHVLADVLQNGLLPTPGKMNYVAVWSSPHMHTAITYPMAMKVAQPLTSIGPAVRIVLTLEVPQSSIMKRIRGKKNSSGLPINYQWPLKPEGICIRAVHVWCYDAHAAPRRAMETLGIAKNKKERALMRDADALLRIIPEDDRDREVIDLERAMVAPARIPPQPRRPAGSAGAALLKVRKKFKRQRRWLRLHRTRIASMNLPQPPEPAAAA